MPTFDINQPTVQVSIPVPGPANTGPKPAPKPKPAPAPQPVAVAPVDPRAGGPRAVIMPHATPPRRMARTGPVRRYSSYTHADFHRRMRENPQERGTVLVYSDWLEENGMPTVASVLRDHVQGEESPFFTGDPPLGSRSGEFQATLHKHTGKPSFYAILNQREAAHPHAGFQWFRSDIPEADYESFYHALESEGVHVVPYRPLQTPRRMSRRVAAKLSRDPHPDKFGFHRSMAENPDDQTAHLVYADWLEDNGSPDAAEIVRSHARAGRGLTNRYDLAYFPQWTDLQPGQGVIRDWQDIHPDPQVNPHTRRHPGRWRSYIEQSTYDPRLLNVWYAQADPPPRRMARSGKPRRYAAGDREAFETAMRQHPDDMTTRLVFADWLDDHAESDHDRHLAALIRAHAAHDPYANPATHRLRGQMRRTAAFRALYRQAGWVPPERLTDAALAIESLGERDTPQGQGIVLTRLTDLLTPVHPYYHDIAAMGARLVGLPNGTRRTNLAVDAVRVPTGEGWHGVVGTLHGHGVSRAHADIVPLAPLAHPNRVEAMVAAIGTAERNHHPAGFRMTHDFTGQAVGEWPEPHQMSRAGRPRRLARRQLRRT